MPKTFPRTVRRAVVRPHAIARAIVKRTLGPGARMIKKAAIEYSQSLEGITIAMARGYRVKPYAQRSVGVASIRYIELTIG